MIGKAIAEFFRIALIGLHKLVALFFKGGSHASFVDFASRQLKQTKKKILTIEQELQRIYKMHGFTWDPKLDVICIQDPSKHNIFNDFVLKLIGKKWYRWRATAEGGTWRKGYWRAKFKFGQYLKLYRRARGNFPTGGNKPLPYMKMNYAIEMISLESGKIRKALDCQLHGTKYQLKKMKVNWLSSGCCALYRAYLGIQTFMKYILWDIDYHFTVLNINECSFIHKIPFYKGEK